MENWANTPVVEVNSNVNNIATYLILFIIITININNHALVTILLVFLYIYGAIAAYCMFPKKPCINVQRTVDTQLSLF